MADQDVMLSSQSRLWVIRDRAAPGNDPIYQSLGRADALSWDQGATTLVRGPSSEAYGQFEVIASTKGVQGQPQITIEYLKKRELSELLELIRDGCPFDVQIHVGACQNPSEFDSGFEIAMILEAAEATSYTTGALGTFDANSNNPVTESAPLTGRDWYEVKKVAGAALAASEIVQEVMGVCICDSRSCGTCGTASDGCQKVFAVQKSHGGSPGVAAEVNYSPDGGVTIGSTNVTSLAANFNPSGIACVGPYLCVISNEGVSLNYATTLDVLDGDETWAAVTSGFVAAKGPNHLFSLGQSFTWFVGDGGYIYFASDITSEVVAQTAGDVSIQNLLGIHGIDKNNLVAVGVSNTVLVTDNGGEVWVAVTGPAGGVTLNCVWMLNRLTWLVGGADGKLYYTQDGGANWTSKSFNNSGSGQVRALAFSTPSVGWMAHDYTPAAGATGRVLRTYNGGNTWQVIPENRNQNLPTNDKINALAACGAKPNLLYAAGLGADGSDGILIKVA